MKFLFASDSFKGTLSSMETAKLLSKAAAEVFGEVECVCIPMADGGEGTADALIEACRGERIYASVHDPLMRKREACYGRLDRHSAVIEMAAASGLTLVPEDKRNPLHTTTYGTGELILDALDRGFEELIIAIGGSATNDGGMGCARALGIRFLDENGVELKGTGSDLENVRKIDTSGLDPRIQKTRITVMCDVSNPLCGENGATYTFAAQKGASPKEQDRLEKGMCNYRYVIRRQFGVDPDQLFGGGAAGGLGTMLTVFLHGKMKSGVETVLDITEFDCLLKEADLVITGEGRTDWQSCFGKVLQGIGVRAGKAGVPVIALSGSLGEGADKVYGHGISSMMTTVDAPMTLQEAMDRAEELYFRGAIRMFRMLKAGMEIGEKTGDKNLNGQKEEA